MVVCTVAQFAPGDDTSANLTSIRRLVSQARAQGSEIVILGEDEQPLAAGEVGEIFFRAEATRHGSYSYVGSTPRQVDGMGTLGDLGWLDTDGYLYIADRRTDMVLIGGVNVYPAEVEAAFEALPEILCCAVIGVPDADLGNRLHAIVELAPEAAAPREPATFIKRAVSSLSPSKRPKSIEFTRERLRDDAGKVRRSALRAQRVNVSLSEFAI